MTDPNTDTPPPVPSESSSNVFLIQELAARHRTIAKQAQTLKDQEMKLRLKLVMMLFPKPEIGTNKILFPAQGLLGKAVVKASIKIDDDATIADIVDTIPNNTGLLKEYYEMSESKYRALPEGEKKKLAGSVTWKPGAPTLEFEGELPEPKTKGCFVHAGKIWSVPLNRYLTLEEGSKLAASLNMEYIELLNVLSEIQ